MERKFIATGILFVFLGIAFAAFGAHGLKELVTVEKIDSFKTGAHFFIYNGLGLMVLGALKDKFEFKMKLHYRNITGGTLLFSISLFLLVLFPVWGLETKYLGPITPIGGALMLFGWLTLFIKYIRLNR